MCSCYLVVVVLVIMMIVVVMVVVVTITVTVVGLVCHVIAVVNSGSAPSSSSSRIIIRLGSSLLCVLDER